jgi:hypothetical protein
VATPKDDRDCIRYNFAEVSRSTISSSEYVFFPEMTVWHPTLSTDEQETQVFVVGRILSLCEGISFWHFAQFISLKD